MNQHILKRAEEGLDFDTIFYMLPYSYLTEIAAHGGFQDATNTGLWNGT